jgi:hypothetical protein
MTRRRLVFGIAALAPIATIAGALLLAVAYNGLHVVAAVNRRVAGALAEPVAEVLGP